jgi:hypothetical protein
MRLSMQSILIGAALVAALLILVRIIWGSPLVVRIRENFGNTTQGNTVTMCPEGTTMIMWDARAYCCGGKINTDTDRVDKVCTPITSDPAAPPPVFCTLDGKTEHVPNCHTIRTDMLMKSGASHCPRDAPNYQEPPQSAGGAVRVSQMRDGATVWNNPPGTAMLREKPTGSKPKKPRAANTVKPKRARHAHRDTADSR